MKKHIKGFTLVELLAVIIVLAIILAIAIPRISNIIESAERSSFVSSTKLLIKAVQTKLLEDETFDVTTINKSNMKTLFNIPDDNYSYVSFRYDSNNKLFAYIEGQGEWDNLSSYGSYDNIDVKTSIIRDGLVLYLDAGNKTSYPGSGTTWYDLSGNGNNGTLVNGVSYTSSNDGSLVFDGIDDYVNYSTINLPATNLTAISWFKTGASVNQTMLSSTDSSRIRGFKLRLDSTGVTRVFVEPDNAVLGNKKYNDNKWHMISAVMSSSGTYVYVDGLLEITYKPALFLGNYTYYRRIGDGGAQEFFSGSINNVSIYNRALSESEIQQNFNAMKYRYG